MKYPKIFLVADNCFASKRWMRPKDWFSIINKCGIKCIESSADTECDMLYSDSKYLESYANEVKELSREFGIDVTSAYTGHGTYSTLGLPHTDKGCRERMLCDWLFRHIDNAEKLGAVAGFYCHSFDDSAVQDSALYEEYKGILYSQMERTAEYAAPKGVLLSLEQMYSPQQYPWKIKDARDLMSK